MGQHSIKSSPKTKHLTHSPQLDPLHFLSSSTRQFKACLLFCTSYGMPVSFYQI
jgi:hypothetical protein